MWNSAWTLSKKVWSKQLEPTVLTALQGPIVPYITPRFVEGGREKVAKCKLKHKSHGLKWPVD